MAEHSLREIPIVVRTVSKITNEFYIKSNEFAQVNNSLQSINASLKNHIEHSRTTTQNLSKDLKKLSDVVFKPSDIDDKIRGVYDMMSNRMKEELAKLLTKVLSSLGE